MPDPDPTPTPTPAPAGPDQNSINAMVSTALGHLLGNGQARVTDQPTGTPAAPPAGDISDQVRRAVEQARTEQERDSRIANLQSSVDELKANRQPEKPPAMIRRVERIMGWHIGDESNT